MPTETAPGRQSPQRAVKAAALVKTLLPLQPADCDEGTPRCPHRWLEPRCTRTRDVGRRVGKSTPPCGPPSEAFAVKLEERGVLSFADGPGELVANTVNPPPPTRKCFIRTQ